MIKNCLILIHTMAIIRKQINNARKKVVNGNKVFIVQIVGDETPHPFGGISAIYDIFTPIQLGVSKSRLWSYGITPERPYKNKNCIIYRGEIHRKKGNRTNKSKSDGKD